MKLLDVNAAYGHTWRVERVGKRYVLHHLPSGKTSVCLIRKLRTVCRIINDKSLLDDRSYFRVLETAR